MTLGDGFMVCIVTGELMCKKGVGRDVLESLGNMLPDTRKRNGFIHIEVSVDQDNPDRIFLYEHWKDRTSHEEYIAWRQERGDFDVLSDSMAEHPKFGYFDLMEI